MHFINKQRITRKDGFFLLKTVQFISEWSTGLRYYIEQELAIFSQPIKRLIINYNDITTEFNKYFQCMQLVRPLNWFFLWKKVLKKFPYSSPFLLLKEMYLLLVNYFV